MASRITITVPRDQTKQTRVEVEGCPGPGCQKLTEAIEQGLGKTVADEKTDEFYEQPLENEGENEVSL